MASIERWVAIGNIWVAIRNREVVSLIRGNLVLLHTIHFHKPTPHLELVLACKYLTLGHAPIPSLPPLRTKRVKKKR